MTKKDFERKTKSKRIENKKKKFFKNVNLTPFYEFMRLLKKNISYDASSYHHKQSIVKANFCRYCLKSHKHVIKILTHMNVSKNAFLF